MINLLARPATRSAGAVKQLTFPWRNALMMLATVDAGVLTLVITAREPLAQLGSLDGGPFWHLPFAAWIGVGLLAALCLLAESNMVRLVALAMFGLTTMAMLGLVEPLGVFHDSWQNVGLGNLSTSAQADVAARVPYVGSSPGAFLLFGVLGGMFSDTASFLRIYPALSVLLYTAGIYMLATAFAGAHKDGMGVNHTRFGLLSAFAFLALGPLFYVRVNPAPQSVAFALMPFCLAAVLQGSANLRFRITGLLAFAAIVVMHPITALMTASVCVAWLGVDRLLRRREEPLISMNTVTLYVSIFVSWLVYIGVWVISTGGSFVTRMLNALNSGQQVRVAASSAEVLQDFVWLHRVGLVGGAVMVIAGLVLLVRANRTAGMHMGAWLLISAAWLPLMLFGEFGDRGPLFALPPAALGVGYLLASQRRPALNWALGVLVVVVAVSTYATAYPNHIGEVVMKQEVDAFSVIKEQSEGRKIAYGYAPPLTGADLEAYANDQLRVYAIGAADFSYDKLARSRSMIVISSQMREAAKLRGPKALEALEKFEATLLGDSNYDLVFDNGDVRAFRAR